MTLPTAASKNFWNGPGQIIPTGITKEGIVIRPLVPVYSEIIGGPLSMKVINNDYLLKE